MLELECRGMGLQILFLSDDPVIFFIYLVLSQLWITF